jgi:hypothetical protein
MIMDNLRARVDREKLYDEVWAEPMTKVAARYDVSSSFLARVCARLNVPRPPRGYWAQLEVGKAPPKPPLPDARPGEELEWSRDGGPARIARTLPKPPDAEVKSRRRPRSPPSTQHELLVQAHKHFEGARELDSGYLRPAKHRVVDVFVSRETLSRALDLANVLFLAFEKAGHRVAFAPFGHALQRRAVDERSESGPDRGGYGSWAPDRATVVYIGTVAFALTIFELSEEVEVKYVDGKYVRTSQLPLPKRRSLYSESTWNHKRHMPSGRLCIRASSSYSRVEWEKQWREAKEGELLSRVRQVVRALEAEAPAIATLYEEGERQAEIERKQWEAQAERWRREAEERRQAETIKESREELFAIIEAWGIAKRIEGFFEDIDSRTTDFSGEERTALLDRLHRARSLLGGVDALQRFAGWKAPDER